MLRPKKDPEKRSEFAKVCRISVEPSPKPVYIEEGAATHFFVRTGNLTQELTTRAAAEFIAGRWRRV